MDSSRKRQRSQLPLEDEEQPDLPLNNLAAEIASDGK
jgi:hypothetical protein